MYDYNNGRFLSVDPFIQAPTSTQSMNPYTYIFNNPLSGIDPTGYCSADASIEECFGDVEAGTAVEITDSNGNAIATFTKTENGGFAGTKSTGAEGAAVNQIAIDSGLKGDGVIVGQGVNTESSDINNQGFLNKLGAGVMKFLTGSESFKEAAASIQGNCEAIHGGGGCSENTVNPEMVKLAGKLGEALPLEGVAVLAANATRAFNTGKKATSKAMTVRVAESAKIPTWHGAGPGDFLAINSAAKSNKLLKSFSPESGVEFIFDTSSNTFVVAREPGGAGNAFHRVLARSIGINTSSKSVVGGIFSRGSKGQILTNESSGTFGRNWTPEIREQFQKAMEDFGLPVTHSETY